MFPLVPDHSNSRAPKITKEIGDVIFDKIIIPLTIDVIETSTNVWDLLNSGKKLANLISDLENQKSQLEFELEDVINIHPAKNIDFNQAKKILELRDLLIQIDKKLSVLIIIQQQNPITSVLKLVRNKALGVAADIVSPSTTTRNK